MQTTSIPGIERIIAVASGKGGVGKSTVSVNLALALAAQGQRVGLLDADIYGPSQSRMLGVSGGQQSDVMGEKHFLPKKAHGIVSMSMAYLVEEDAPMVWRGPMAIAALQQLLYDTDWGTLDTLVVDLPPGTGDIQLTLAQKIPLSGAVIVTTPQDIALLDVRRAVGMFNKVKVSVLGVVENMSTHICSQCGHEDPVFGAGGGETIAKECDVPLLAKIPLDARIQQQTDQGQPTVVADPEGALAQHYQQLAKSVQDQLAEQPKDYRHKFPKIVVESE